MLVPGVSIKPPGTSVIFLRKNFMLVPFPFSSSWDMEKFFAHVWQENFIPKGT